MEGIVAPLGKYVPDKERTNKFLSELKAFCSKNSIKLYLISGYHKDVAQQKLSDSFLRNFFDKEYFLFVNHDYINSKSETDKKLHLDNLEKNPEFNDSYFKQVAIQNVLKENSLEPSDALLLSDDLWVDGYYTTRFSKIDFAIFEENIADRGNPVERISGLAYFKLDFSSVKILLENFPKVDYTALNKYVFEKMKEVLMKDVDFSGLIKKQIEKTQGNLGE